MNFGEALERIKQGESAAREGWNGKGMWIGLMSADEESEMDRPYIYMCTVNKEFVPWVASQTDLLAEDWMIE